MKLAEGMERDEGRSLRQGGQGRGKGGRGGENRKCSEPVQACLRTSQAASVVASAAGEGVTWQDLEHRGLRACGEDFGFDLNRLKALSRGGM